MDWNGKQSPWHPLPGAFRQIAAESPRAVLLETARQDCENDRSLLFLDPARELVAWKANELDELLREVDRWLAEGCFVAGYFSYECGERFVGLTSVGSEERTPDRPLAWLGVYRSVIQFAHGTGVIQGSLPVSRGENAVPSLQPVLRVEGLQIAKQDYEVKIGRVQDYLAAGHTYQVNFTDRLSGSLEADPLEVYNTLLEQQPVSFAAYIHREGGPILSFSPELFYRTSRGQVTVRPMKGTWPRGTNLETDREAGKLLRGDGKNRSEHVTIVDLLRNDVGKICELGSVRVERFMDVERYATLLQMTSTISGSLSPHLTSSAIFRHLFPSGSITGAPKRRTMEIIRELESGPRGVYTGAIGFWGPGDEACFNVAIRTMEIQANQFTLGTGGGITADSRAEEEYRECELKAAFLTRRDRPFSLIETMRCSGGIALLAGHLQRLAASAAYFQIAYDESALHRELEEVVHGCGNQTCRVRLLLHLDGSWRIAASPLEETPWSGRILLVSERTVSSNPFLHHKTTNRSLYDQNLSAAKQAGFDEVLFLNEQGYITEGAISNLFLEAESGWMTPALRCGVLPGVQRAVFLVEHLETKEEEILLEDMQKAKTIWMGNALRGLREVYEICGEDGLILWRGRK